MTNCANVTLPVNDNSLTLPRRKPATNPFHQMRIGNLSLPRVKEGNPQVMPKITCNAKSWDIANILRLENVDIPRKVDLGLNRTHFDG